MTNQQFQDQVSQILYEFSPKEDVFKSLINRYEIYHPTYEDEVICSKVLDYFKERLIRHKIEVRQAGMELIWDHYALSLINVPSDDKEIRFNLAIHDLSKFSVTEALPYATHDFSNSHSKGTPEFQYAWCHHKAVNPHHPEHWYNPTRSGKLNVLPMQDIYIVEMLADWIGAGRTWGNELETWLPDNLHTFVFHDETMEKLKMILEHLHYEVEKKEGKLFTTGLKR